MRTLGDLGNKAVEIRDAIDHLKISGRENASIVVFISTRCNEIIRMVNEAAAEIQNGKHPFETAEEVMNHDNS